MASLFPSMSVSERRFLEDGAKAGVRADGRSRLESRCVRGPPLPACCVLHHERWIFPKGSFSRSLVHLLGFWWHVNFVEQAELGTPDRSRPDEGRIECSVECWASATHAFQTREVAEFSADLKASLETCIQSRGTLDRGALCVVPGTHCWVLHLDVMVLEAGGNLPTALSLAAYTALNSARLPRLTLIPAETSSADVGGDYATSSGLPDIEVDDNPTDARTVCELAHADKLPVVVTLAHVAGHVLLDPSKEEEAVASAQLQVTVNAEGHICGLLTRTGRSRTRGHTRAGDDAVGGAGNGAMGVGEEEEDQVGDVDDDNDNDARNAGNGPAVEDAATGDTGFALPLASLAAGMEAAAAAAPALFESVERALKEAEESAKPVPYHEILRGAAWHEEPLE